MTSYIPNYENDILVSYAKADGAWMSTLVNGIKVLLAQKLGGTDIFSLCIHEATQKNGNVDELIKKSAFFLFILSREYSKSERCRDEFEKICQATKGTPNRLIIVEKGPVEEAMIKLPDFIITRYKFWVEDENGTPHVLSVPSQETEKAKYYQRLYEVANRLEQELTIFRAKASLTNLEQSAVFIDAAPQDLDLAEEIKVYLEEKKHISCKPPINFDASPAEIRKELDGNLLSCRDIIVFCDSVPDIWVEEHIKYYRKVLLRRDNNPVRNLIVLFRRRKSESDKLKLSFPKSLHEIIKNGPKSLECDSLDDNCLHQVAEELQT